MRVLRIGPCVLLILSLASPAVLADCADGLSVIETKQALANGSKLEAAGRYWSAINAYHKAQDYVCDMGGNPVAPEAIKKAAALGRKQGKLASQNGNWFNDSSLSPGAFQWYEQGLLFAEADKALITALKQKPDNMSLSGFAQQHFATRNASYFIPNNKLAVATLGGYQLDQSQLAYVTQLPSINVKRLLDSYAGVLPDSYLSEFANLDKQSYVKDSNDILANMKVQQLGADFQQHWHSDRLDDSNNLFDQADSWARQNTAVPVSDKLSQQVQLARIAHADRLLQKYSDAPQLLGDALSIYQQTDQKTKLQSAKQKAAQYAQQAMQAENYNLANHFYGLAGDDENAALAQAKMDQKGAEMAESMASGYAAQAAKMQKMFSDPERIKELQQQALKLQQQLQSKQQNNNTAQKAQEQLESDLGL
jgi:hypothetical protein